MKFSKHYFEYSAKVRDYLTLEMCAYTVKNYLSAELQADGRMKYWAHIEKYNKYLRVVVENDGETIVTAFFDRNYIYDKGK